MNAKPSWLIVFIATIISVIAGTHLWSYATSCGCINLNDIRAFYNDQVAQQDAYLKLQKDYKNQEQLNGSYDWTLERNEAMMNEINQAVTGAYDPSAVHVGAETNGFTCSIGNYRWRSGPLGSPPHDGYPDLCLKELVDVHENVHVDACQRMDKFWNYKQYMTMAETAGEEIWATQTAKNYIKQLLNDLEREFCCKLDPPVAGPVRLGDIIANLLR